MADIQLSGTRSKRGGIRSKKLSTRVDLTPMVDLGFLLITFFIFTTTMSQAKAMNLVLPDDKPVNDPTTAADSKTISLILGGDNVIYYYYGLHTENILQTDYAATGLRQVIQDKIKKLHTLYGKDGEIVVLIKPTGGATYKNVIDVMDEMLINDVKKYVMVDEPDSTLLKGSRSLSNKPI